MIIIIKFYLILAVNKNRTSYLNLKLKLILKTKAQNHRAALGPIFTILLTVKHFIHLFWKLREEKEETYDHLN